MDAFGCQHLSREFQACEDVVSLQVWKLRKHVVDGISTGEVFENRLHGVAQASHGGLAMTDAWIHGDAREQVG